MATYSINVQAFITWSLTLSHVVLRNSRSMRGMLISWSQSIAASWTSLPIFWRSTRSSQHILKGSMVESWYVLLWVNSNGICYLGCSHLFCLSFLQEWSLIFLSTISSSRGRMWKQRCHHCWRFLIIMIWIPCWTFSVSREAKLNFLFSSCFVKQN